MEEAKNGAQEEGFINGYRYRLNQERAFDCDPRTAMHPHTTCPHCHDVTFDELVRWFVDHASATAHQLTAERFLKAFTVTKKG